MSLIFFNLRKPRNQRTFLMQNCFCFWCKKKEKSRQIRSSLFTFIHFYPLFFYPLFFFLLLSRYNAPIIFYSFSIILTIIHFAPLRKTHFVLRFAPYKLLVPVTGPKFPLGARRPFDWKWKSEVFHFRFSVD